MFILLEMLMMLVQTRVINTLLSEGALIVGDPSTEIDTIVAALDEEVII